MGSSGSQDFQSLSAAVLNLLRRCWMRAAVWVLADHKTLLSLSAIVLNLHGFAPCPLRRLAAPGGAFVMTRRLMFGLSAATEFFRGLGVSAWAARRAHCPHCFDCAGIDLDSPIGKGLLVAGWTLLRAGARRLPWSFGRLRDVLLTTRCPAPWTRLLARADAFSHALRSRPRTLFIQMTFGMAWHFGALSKRTSGSHGSLSRSSGYLGRLWL